MKIKAEISNYKDIYLVNITFLVIGFCLYIFLHKTEAITATIATGISLSIGLRQYRTENDKIFKELFITFNAKYDTKFNDELIKIDKGKDEIDENLIIDYLNLCAEEYLWYRMGRIPEIVWHSWERGMVYYLNIDAINKIIIAEKGQEDSYYGLFDKIGKRIKNWG